MSKYSRTRKAICRISHLDYWLIDKNSFKRFKPRTMKEQYKEHRKTIILFYGYNPSNLISNVGNRVKLPCKYKDALNMFIIWHLF